MRSTWMEAPLPQALTFECRHLEITAFLASLCKVCGIFSSGTIPPNVNFRIPNPAIKWSQYRLCVPVEPEPLRCRSGNGRSLVAMTSSGIGGANGHAVLEGPPEFKRSEPFWIANTELPVLFVVGALSPRSASALGEAVLITARDSSGAASLARLVGRRARSMTWRSFAVTAGAGKTVSFSKPIIVPKTRPPIVFVFSGQGTQHFHSKLNRILSSATSTLTTHSQWAEISSSHARPFVEASSSSTRSMLPLSAHRSLRPLVCSAPPPLIRRTHLATHGRLTSRSQL